MYIKPHTRSVINTKIQSVKHGTNKETVYLPPYREVAMKWGAKVFDISCAGNGSLILTMYAQAYTHTHLQTCRACSHAYKHTNKIILKQY